MGDKKSDEKRSTNYGRIRNKRKNKNNTKKIIENFRRFSVLNEFIRDLFYPFGNVNAYPSLLDDLLGQPVSAYFSCD